jgi:hypothetical protein
MDPDSSLQLGRSRISAYLNWYIILRLLFASIQNVNQVHNWFKLNRRNNLFKKSLLNSVLESITSGKNCLDYSSTIFRNIFPARFTFLLKVLENVLCDKPLTPLGSNMTPTGTWLYWFILFSTARSFACTYSYETLCLWFLFSWCLLFQVYLLCSCWLRDNFTSCRVCRILIEEE